MTLDSARDSVFTLEIGLHTTCFILSLDFRRMNLWRWRIESLVMKDLCIRLFRQKCPIASISLFFVLQNGRSSNRLKLVRHTGNRELYTLDDQRAILPLTVL